MTPQRRAALGSVFAAAALVGLKLSVGLAANSLGILSEALHSATDLVAALLTFFAVGVAARPADVGHQYGHGKAEHLAALAEATFLVGASIFISVQALERLFHGGGSEVEATWWAIGVIVLVIAIDASRATVSWRVARRYSSAALASNALHFASDLVGSAAVLVGLLLARAGYTGGDSIAALFVGGLVLVGAARLIKRNVDVLMDRAPADAEAAAMAAIRAIDPPVDVRRLRMRHAAGRQFADVVIGVAPGAAVGQGHAAADAVEAAVEGALPGSDVVVHVEPREDEAGVRDRAHAAALGVRGVREIHNLALLDVGGRMELSLHLKLPGDLPLDDAHALAEQVERAILAAVPEIDDVVSHLEPLAEGAAASEEEVDSAAIEDVVRHVTGRSPRTIRLLRTDAGMVVFLTLELDPQTPLHDAHARASEVEERIRAVRPDVDDVIVHTEP